jgi:hypothetical protein
VKLTVELIPSSLWGFSLCNFYAKANPQRWREIKEDIVIREGDKCWICGKKGRLEAHEFWDYDEKNKIQKLVAIHCLCIWCHRIKHIGRSLFTLDGQEELGDEGKQQLVSHFCKVNRCSLNDFEKHQKESFEDFHRRSSMNWYQDFGLYEKEIMDLLLK